eukprot:3792481-Pyramimonas_sp.AAC.1
MKIAPPPAPPLLLQLADLARQVGRHVQLLLLRGAVVKPVGNLRDGMQAATSTERLLLDPGLELGAALGHVVIRQVGGRLLGASAQHPQH